MNAKKTKTALVLAGGGLTGAVYEIGALRAIDDLLVDRTVNDFDIYVGTSAGSLVAAFIANGMSPEAMLQAIEGQHPNTKGLERKHIFQLNWWDYVNWGLKLPFKLAGAWSHYLRHISDMTLFDLLWSLSEALPSGLYESQGLAQFIQEGFASMGYSDDFEQTPHDLYIIATDLDSGERAVFGKGYLHAPVSMAVASSSALPMMYKPVRVGDHDYIDGGARGTASIDLAIELGANLVVCINPLVPFDNHDRLKIPFFGQDGEKGIQSIVNQTFRIMMHSGLHYHIKQVQRSHPQVDIILIEPSPEDYQMFFYNIMRYSSRLIVAQHGFESVTLDLAMDYPEYREILFRHDIPITRRLVIEELNQIAASNYDPEVIRQVLEARIPLCSARRRDTPVCHLSQTLAQLEMALDQLEKRDQPQPAI